MGVTYYGKTENANFSIVGCHLCSICVANTSTHECKITLSKSRLRLVEFSGNHQATGILIELNGIRINKFTTKSMKFGDRRIKIYYDENGRNEHVSLNEINELELYGFNDIQVSNLKVNKRLQLKKIYEETTGYVENIYFSNQADFVIKDSSPKKLFFRNSNYENIFLYLACVEIESLNFQGVLWTLNDFYAGHKEGKTHEMPTKTKNFLIEKRATYARLKRNCANAGDW